MKGWITPEMMPRTRGDWLAAFVLAVVPLVATVGIVAQRCF